MTIPKRLKTVGRVIVAISLVLFLLMIFVSFATHLASGGRTVFGKYSFGVVATGSMEPDIQTGSFILVEVTDPSVLKIGDVISFRSSDPTVPEGVPVTHRIERIETDENGERRFITKGVANSEEDEYPVYDGDIYGRVTFHNKLIGTVVRLTQSRWLFPILIIVLIVNLGFSAVAVYKEAKKLKDPKK